MDPEDPHLRLQKGVEKERLGLTLNDLDLSIRARLSLERGGIDTIPKLIKRSRAELLVLGHLGKLTLKGIEKSLAEFGLRLRGA